MTGLGVWASARPFRGAGFNDKVVSVKFKIQLVLAFASLVSTAVLADYRGHPKTERFIAQLVNQHGFDRAYLESVLGQAEYKQSIVDAMTRPAEKTLTWGQYRNIFIKDKRIQAGKKFLEEHRQIFDKVEAKYGVPRELIAAIIGVETFYGANKGSYRVIDALATLGFDYPPRAAFFEKQLENVFLLAREQRLDIAELTGSYAGAMGYGQFIPSSYRAYAVDYDGDKVADIWHNEGDAIASVANYFAEHGWRSSAPVAHPVSLTRAVNNELINDNLKPLHTAAFLRQLGVTVPDSIYGSESASLMEYETDDGLEYWAGWHNFYVITRYNHSRLYALAVYQLSQALL